MGNLRAMLLLSVFSISAGVSGAKADTMIAGAGAMTCGQIEKLYRNNPDLIENLVTSWSQGFMSGINIYAHERSKKTTDLAPNDFDTDRQTRYLLNFCDKNPLATMVQGILDLFEYMRARQGLGEWR